MTPQLRYKLRVPASYLPDPLIRWLHRHWKVGFDPSDGWTFWMDASYERYHRREER